jgi:myo-inositol 2-dehydrogenase / D-chiro-inositol 1-dehydrogenase
VQIGLIGCGGIARQFHLRALARMPGVRVVAVADPRPEARSRAAAMTGARAASDADELLGEPDIDAVVICAETGAHASLAQATADAGKDFYLEKPIAASGPDAMEVVAAGERRAVHGAIGFNFRLHPMYARARRLVQDDRVGRIRRVRSRFYEPVDASRMPAWRRHRASGGGVLLDLGSHHVDLVRWLLDEEIEHVDEAEITSTRSEADAARFHARSAGGAEIEIELSYLQGRVCEWELIGDRGRILLDRYRGSVRVRDDARPERSRRRRRAIEQRLRALPIPRREHTFRLSLEAFVAALRDGRSAPASLEDGLRSLEVLLAAEAIATAR